MNKRMTTVAGALGEDIGERALPCTKPAIPECTLSMSIYPSWHLSDPPDFPMKLPTITLLLALLVHTAHADVRINEIMSSNGSTIADEDGDFEDWIELLNTGESTVDLSGWGLSDNEGNPFKWVFPHGTSIGSGKFLLVWASGKDRTEIEDGSYSSDWIENFPNSSGLWIFDGNDAAHVQDSSIHGNHGAVAGAERVNLGETQVMEFDSWDLDEVTVANSPSLQTTGSMTLSMWLKPREIGRRQNPWEKAFGGEGTITMESNGRLTFIWGTSGGNSAPYQAFSSVSVLPENEWTHVVVVRDLANSRLSWYFNGSVVATGTPLYAAATPSTRPVKIGRGYAGAYHGKIGMVMLLPEALDDPSVKALYQDTRGAYRKHPHTNFSISSAGEPVMLTRADGIVAAVLPAALLRRDVSYGHADSGLRVFTDPSPLRENPGEGWLGVLPQPGFSVPGGFYQAPFDLEISAASGAAIHYTLDGSEPLASRAGGETYHYKDAYPAPAGSPYGPLLVGEMAAHPYDTPIPITDRTDQPNRLSGIATQFANEPRAPAGNLRKATVVKARAELDGYLPSDVATHTYFVEADVMGRFDLPVLSLSTDDVHLFGYDEGIYVPGKIADEWRAKYPTWNTALWRVEANYWQKGLDWERPLHVEYFSTDGGRHVAMDVGARIHGGASRSAFRKSLRLYTRSAYQTGSIEYPLFGNLAAKDDPTRSITSFDRLILRNSGNDSTGTLYHDALVHALVRHLPVDVQAWQPAMHYINGESWGLINIRERQDSRYIRDHHGIDRRDLSILGSWTASLEDGDPFGQTQYRRIVDDAEAADTTDPAVWSDLVSKIDVSNHAFYHAFQIYIANLDWPQNNIRFWKKMTPVAGPGTPSNHDGRWRWMIFDTDLGFQNTNVSHDSLSRIANPPAGGSVHTTTRLFRALMRNPEYEVLFINHLVDLMNSAFVAGRVHAKVDEFNALLADSRAEHFNRWQSSGTVNTGGGIKSFATTRPAHVRQHVIDFFDLGGIAEVTVHTPDPSHGTIQINTLQIDESLPGHPNPSSPYPWTGTYFQDVPITLRAIPEPGHRFSGWQELPDEESAEIEVTLTGDATFTAMFEEEPLPLAIHAWIFEDVGGYLAPSQSLVSGAGLVITPGTTTEVLRNPAAQDFPTAHLRINNPLGAMAHYSLPTTGIESITLDFLTRRSGQGAGEQTLSYTLNGSDWIGLETYAVQDAAPQAKFFDFTTIEGVDDNPDFAVRITFSQTDEQLALAPPGGLAGNNRFDNMVLRGFALPGVNLPPMIDFDALPVGLPSLRAADAPVLFDFTAIFSDPDGDPLTFAASSSRPGIAGLDVAGGQLAVTGLAAGESVITLAADDGLNPPVSTSFAVLVYPSAHELAAGPFVFDEWDAANPAMSFPEHMIFLQSEVSDPGLTTELNRAYQIIPLEDAAVPANADFPYAASARTRINGLGEDGIAFINTGRGRDLGAALVALDTTGLSAANVSFTAATLLENSRIYAIRLQYRVGDDGPFIDVTDAAENPVEYLRSTTGDVADFGPVSLPAEALDEPYVQLLWRYHHVDGSVGPRAQLRLDDIVITTVTPGGPSFAQWQASEFSESELLDPDVSGPAADPTGSGIVNLMRYALGLGRNDPPWDALPAMSTTGGFSFPMDPEKSDISYRVTASDDLDDWPVILYDSASDSEPAPVDGRVTIPIDLGDPGKRFYRLEVRVQ